MKLLCIDPGTTKSGVVVFDGENVTSVFPEIENEALLINMQLAGVRGIFKDPLEHLAIEMVASYGMAVGAETFETCVWIGRFIQAFGAENHTKIYRKDVKMCLCQSMRAKDKNVRQAILDRFPRTGGGKTPQIGIKSKPGSLYGVSRHAWSALAVGITWFENESK
jgi:hypothetical protein